MSLWTSAVAAQDTVPSDDERAAAQVLFDEGRKLIKEEKIELACAKFAESMRLDNAVGTQLNLADCYEKLGRTASAWINWVEAAARSKKAGQEKRQAIAEERAAALEGTLSRMTITVPHDVDGLEIRRDGELVGRAQWGIAMPVDPGVREIVATAPGKKPWKKRVKVGKESDNVMLEVDKLANAPVEKKTTTLVEDNTPQLAGGIAALGVGAVGIGLGIGFGVLAMNKNDESLPHCLPDDENKCSSEGASLRREAITFSHVSTAGFVVGGVGIVLGIVLIATTPGIGSSDEGDKPKERALIVPWLDPKSGGMLFHTRW
ncbi:MAG TPA: hypothetical protein VFB62_19005 [Polyangiaceae bacterium]|jgi:hypothetical protein|nr:hypothetical protein [Polyangiaceae bacterium]